MREDGAGAVRRRETHALGEGENVHPGEEGGGQVSASFIAKNLVDRVYLYRSGMFLGENSVSSVSDLGYEDIPLEKKFFRKNFRLLENDVFEEWKSIESE